MSEFQFGNNGLSSLTVLLLVEVERKLEQEPVRMAQVVLEWMRKQLIAQPFYVLVSNDIMN